MPITLRTVDSLLIVSYTVQIHCFVAYHVLGCAVSILVMLPTLFSKQSSNLDNNLVVTVCFSVKHVDTTLALVVSVRLL